MYQSISFNDPEFKTKLVKQFKLNGVAVINNVFTDIECDTYMDGIVNNFIRLGTGLKKDDIKTWTDYNLPPQTRPGLYQSLMTNLQQIWDIRSHQNIKSIFKILYYKLRNKEIDEFIVSGDGINIKPNMGPLHNPQKSKDWPHLDQTIRKDTYKCIQGQAVLTNTTASFVASPKSHLLYEEILDKLGIDSNDKSNWAKIKPENIEEIKTIILAKKGSKWQIPILSKKGSFIVWASSLVHSAKLQDKIEPISHGDIYLGWRCVVYVCYRPKEEFTLKEIEKRKQVFETNRVTNHWGTKIFPKKQGGRFLFTEKRHDIIEAMLNNPITVYDKINKPVLNDNQKKLLGII